MTAAEPLRFAVLGDSIAYGQGATRTADTIGARLAAELDNAGTPTDLTVLAVPRARSADLAAQVRRVPPGTLDLALVIIGANDLTHFVPVEQAAAQLGHAVRALRGLGAQVVVVPAPDLSAVPWIPVQFRALVRTASAALRSAQMRTGLAEGARIAPVDATAAAFADDPSLFSDDHFHPSSAGYARIAQALLPSIAAAASDARRRREPPAD